MSEPMTPRRWTVWVCPECGEQELHFRQDEDRPEATYCLNHEDEDRQNRPAHVEVEVMPVSEHQEALRELERLRSIVNALPPSTQSAVVYGLGVACEGKALDPEKVTLSYPNGHPLTQHAQLREAAEAVAAWEEYESNNAPAPPSGVKRQDAWIALRAALNEEKPDE